SFTNPELLGTALTHRSARADHNERLEFLGDAVLDLIVSDDLYQSFPQATEGDLSRLRARLVKRDALAEAARRVELGTYIELGSGELKSGGFRRSSILADAFEAVIGAVYLDGGFEVVRALVRRLLAQEFSACDLETSLKDPKTQLQEYLQARQQALPEYTVMEVSGEPHEQTFTVRCSAEGLVRPAVGVGSSRRKAEQAAARAALAQLVR
ncbi:MAG: hypothetical protein AMJ69_12620, partial [Gammaproteobacteria bacterium SG8_47]